MSILDSPALGAGATIAPCRDPLRPAEPGAPDAGPALGLTLSGGGFRATLAALGAARYLADAGLLGNVRYVSSVSGGSIANAIVALEWPALRRERFSSAAVDDLLVDPTVKRVSSRSLKLSLLLGGWRTLGRATRTDLLADRIDEWFLGGLLLEHLDPEVRWVFNAANLITGVRFGFERDVVGDYVSGLVATRGSGLRVAEAVATSAAVPGVFAPWTVEAIRFPCAVDQPVLLDGGVYDNTGLEALDGERYRDVFLVTMNAGGLLRPGPYGRAPLVRDLARANALLYRQSVALRTRMMVERFRAGERVPAGQPLPEGARRGVLVALATSFPPDETGGLPAWRAAFPEERSWQGKDLSLVPTVFDKLPPELCRRLIYRGWWVVGAAMARYHPAHAPDPSRLKPPPLRG
jgi:NTE family protein